MKLVFEIRNYPEDVEITKNYKKLINDIDSNNLVSGLIFANPGAYDINDVPALTYGENIPYQYSFKESIIDELNSMLATTIFYKRVNT